MAKSKVTIQNSGEAFEVRKGTILDAALKAGTVMPHECRTGTCGTCKCRLVSGLAVMDSWESSALSEADVAAGLILACRARPRGDVVVALAGAAVAHPVRTVPATVVGLEAPTHDVRIVRLAPAEPLDFSAGQYVRLTFGDAPPRAYSMANRPSEPVLEFHVRVVSDGMASSYVDSTLALGDPVQVEGPFGTASLDGQSESPILAVAGGTGLAPIRSIVREALARSPDRRIAVYFGVRDERDVYGEAEMRALMAQHSGLGFTVVLSHPSEPTERRTGYVHTAVAEDFADLAEWTVHTAGPPLMVEALTGVVQGKGASPAAVHADPFVPAAPAKRDGLIASLRRLLG